MNFNNWVPEPDKCLSEKEAEKLLETSKVKTQVKTGKPAIRDYFIVHLALATGLRVMEIAALSCGDLFLENVVPSLLVRKGKGNKRRIVFFNTVFKKHCKEYLNWKNSIDESIEKEQPLIMSSNTGKHMTTRAIQKAFKRCAEDAELPARYSIHCLRHSYACFLLKASNWNMRLVQKQLGHSRISTTQVYADVMMPDIKNALEKLFI
ncbi:MAG: tyrosine-type recombinase/integrase [Phycisphaerae bacterium]|jgi:site-specific recombinase XerD